jgi:CTP synthase (UTP-ammonia lyase)
VLVEYARNVAGIDDAVHAEVDDDGVPVIVLLACSLVGERRMVQTVPGTRARAICGAEPMVGYHFCSYGLAPEMVPRLAAAGLVISGYADDGTIEILELPSHPFLLATLFQPQVSSEGGSLHPILTAFGEAVVMHHQQRAATVR